MLGTRALNKSLILMCDACRDAYAPAIDTSAQATNGSETPARTSAAALGAEDDAHPAASSDRLAKLSADRVPAATRHELHHFESAATGLPDPHADARRGTAEHSEKHDRASVAGEPQVAIVARVHEALAGYDHAGPRRSQEAGLAPARLRSLPGGAHG